MESLAQHPDEAGETKRTALSKCLVYLSSPNGGDNYWARVITSLDKQYTSEIPTLAVSLSPNNRYMLLCNNQFFEKLSPAAQKLVLIHEAGHVVLRHIERFFRLMAQVQDPLVRFALTTAMNFAADFAVNDAVVRPEKEFTRVHKPRGSKTGELTFLLPEEFGFKSGLSFEQYILLLLKDLPKIHKKIQEMLKEMEAEEGQGEGEEGEDGESQGNGEGQSQDANQPGGKNGKSGKGKGKPSRNGNGGSSGDQDEPGLPPGLAGRARAHPEMFRDLKKFFDKLSHDNHKGWNQKAEKMTPEEAISAANKLKKHAQQVVRSANQQTQRSRGHIPASIEKLIAQLLEAEKLPWDAFFQDLVATAIGSKVSEAMAMPNASLIATDYAEPWPGYTLDPAFHVVWMTDTSGSMADKEYARALVQMNALLAVNRNITTTYIENDAAIQKVEDVTNLQMPDQEELRKLGNRKGYGGTVYGPVFRYLAGIDTPHDWMPGVAKPEDKPKTPDLMIIATDGGVSLEDCLPIRPECGIIWLIMPGCQAAPGMDNVAPDHVVLMFEQKTEFEK